MIDAENHPGDLGAPGSHQPGKPKNLASPQLKADIFKLTFAGQMLYIEQDVSYFGLPFRKEGG